MSEQRFEDLEVRLAYQDQMLAELNEVVTDQQARLMQLETLVEALRERLRAMSESGGDGDAAPADADEKPPHY